MATAYTILKVVDEGLLSLETKAADVLDWWTATDARKDVTLRHLMSMTSGIGPFPIGFGMCTKMRSVVNGTRLCAREAYDRSFPVSYAGPGHEFFYTESTWYIASAMVLEVTGLEYWDDVFQTYMAGPLEIDPAYCQFSMPSRSAAYAGSGLWCSTEGYGKILQAVVGKTLYKNTSLYQEAERPHTLDATPPCGPACIVYADQARQWQEEKGREPGATDGIYWHYGLGQWVECATPKCEDGVLRTSSAGAFGSYPWVDRGGLTGYQPHWGIVIRMWKLTGRPELQEYMLPLAAATVL